MISPVKYGNNWQNWVTVLFYWSEVKTAIEPKQHLNHNSFLRLIYCPVFSSFFSYIQQNRVGGGETFKWLALIGWGRARAHFSALGCCLRVQCGTTAVTTSKPLPRSNGDTVRQLSAAKTRTDSRNGGKGACPSPATTFRSLSAFRGER